MAEQHPACVFCGEPSDPGRYEPCYITRVMKERTICFGCGFWAEKVREKDDPTYVRISGMQYKIGPELPKSRGIFRGFGGSPFVIRFHDGRVVQTTNLWNNGIIPKWYRDELPNNAVFVRPESN